MTLFPEPNSPAFDHAIEQLGWTLIHSLWQFALVAFLAAMVHRTMRRRSATARYAMLVGAMAIMIALPALTWCWLAVGQPMRPVNAHMPAASSFDRSTTVNAIHIEVPTGNLPGSAGSATLTDAAPKASAAYAAPQQQNGSSGDRWRLSARSWWVRVRIAVHPWLAWIVVGWCCGVAACSLRPLVGCYNLHRLRRTGTSAAPGETVAAVRHLSQKLRLHRAVTVLQSTIVRVPVVLGYLRPVILLPLSLATLLPADQLETLLAHELAHVRRHDFLVNLLQALAETIYFYHPCTWWLSRQIRIEREYCCDDLVVNSLGNPLIYSRALLAIEIERAHGPRFALSAADGSLLARVRRIVANDPIESRANSCWLKVIGCIASGLAVCAIPMSRTVAGKPADIAPQTPISGSASGGVQGGRQSETLSSRDVLAEHGARTPIEDHVALISSDEPTNHDPSSDPQVTSDKPSLDAVASEERQPAREQLQFVELAQGETRSLKCEDDMRRIDGFDPTIVEITAESSRIFRAKGLKPGITIVTFTDRAEREFAVPIEVQIADSSSPARPVEPIPIATRRRNPLNSPIQVMTVDAMLLRVGEERVVDFREPLRTVRQMASDVVVLKQLTPRQIRIRGLKAGTTTLVVDMGSKTADAEQCSLRIDVVIDPLTRDEVRTIFAVAQGVDYLKSQQREVGSWPESAGHAGGVTALVTLALLHAGMPVEDVAIQKALHYLRATEPKTIYTVALQTMVFCAASPTDDAARIRKFVTWIQDAQVMKDSTSRGGWSYSPRLALTADGSCTLFAVLGLHAAQRARFEVRRATWQRVCEYWLASQNNNGGWGYTVGSSSTASMTLAGIVGLTAANRSLPVKTGQIARQAALTRAFEAAEKDVTVLLKSHWPFYTLHCMERAAHLSGDAVFRGDWKHSVTKRLIEAQHADGSWSAGTNGVGGRAAAESPLIATSFALLVLTGRQAHVEK